MQETKSWNSKRKWSCKWDLNIIGESGQENGTNTFSLVLSARGCLMIASTQGCDFMFYLIVPLQCCCCWETSSLLAQRGECLWYCYVKFFHPGIDCDSYITWDSVLWKGTKHVKFAEQEKSIKALHSTIMRTIHFVDTKDKRWCLTDPSKDVSYSTLYC